MGDDCSERRSISTGKMCITCVCVCVCDRVYIAKDILFDIQFFQNGFIQKAHFSAVL